MSSDPHSPSEPAAASGPDASPDPSLSPAAASALPAEPTAPGMPPPTQVPSLAAAPPAAPPDKREHYFQSAGLPSHHLALREQLPPKWRRRLTVAGAGLALFATGLLAGLSLAPDSPKTAEKRIRQLEEGLLRRQQDIAALEQQMQVSISGGRLKKSDRLRHEREGRRYAASLRRTGAQGAGDLMEWFVGRWDQLLDAPQEDDRATRRAATLALLVGGMAANINPGDYVPWQAEFLGGNWLGELHFDVDGDGLPGKRSDANRHDGFANVSVCQVAMALNQSMRDAQVLMMPEMRCDRPEARMSVFLQGKTLNDALDEFVRAVKSQGFIAKEKEQHGMRLVLVGNRPRAGDESESGE